MSLAQASYTPPAEDERPARPRVAGKFLARGEQRLLLRGVTYGTFAPGAHGSAYSPETVEQDFAMIAENGFNAVRLYDVPPAWLLDAALRHGLLVLAGLPWEQESLFLGRRSERAILCTVSQWVQQLAGHPALLGIALANEIPASLVRFLGRRRVERFIRKLHRAARKVDPDALLTYVNYPSTEYLDLPFLDFLAFNVFLENEDAFAAYLPRLHNLAGDRPLLLTELGLDSRRHGERVQAQCIAWQIRRQLAAGCAGAFVFAWTDEWHRGGQDIDDWDFGLTTRARVPKPALAAARRAFADGPLTASGRWPRISVVVCSYNGARTLDDCLQGLQRLEYPDFEVIVVDDGSTDATAEIAAHYPVRLIRTANQGLSAARNEGLCAATGEIVAYTDDDARPDPGWLTYLAIAFEATGHAGIGGPNIAPPGDGAIAECVAASPGGPVHVLLSDTLAEHIPGCNMAFRKAALEATGGFDPRFRAAGDDVDVCWRLQEAGYTLGFHAGAMVWHHRRNSLRAYWRQQKGYGKAEALLAAKWPERYNLGGHLAWQGRLYGRGLGGVLRAAREAVFHGSFGAAAFQRVYQSPVASIWSLPQTPEWLLVAAVLAGLSLVGFGWPPLLYGSLPLLAMALLLSFLQACRGAGRALRQRPPRGRPRFSLTFLMHLLQPLARLRGRMANGLTPLRSRGLRGFALPRPRLTSAWSGEWQSQAERLAALQARLKAAGLVVLRGGDFDRWDLEVRGGWFASARLLLAVEEHGRGIQRVVARTWPRLHAGGLLFVTLGTLLGAGALASRAWWSGGLLAAVTGLLVLKTVWEAGSALRALRLPPAGSVASRGRNHDGSRPPSSMSYLPRVLAYLRPYKLLTGASVVITILAALSGLLLPWPLKILIDNVLGGQAMPGPLATVLGPIGDDRESLLLFAVIASLVIHLTINFLSVALEYVTTKLELSVVLDFRSDLFRHAQRLSVPYADQVSTGRMMYGVNFEAAAAGAVVVTVLPLLQSALTLAGMLWIAFKIDPLLALLSLTVVPILTYAVRFYAQRIQPELHKVKGMEMESLSIVHEAMQLLRIVTAFGRDEHEHRRYRDVGLKTVDQRVALTVKQTLFSLVVNMTTAAGTALVLGFGAYHALEGRLTAGELLVVMSYIAAVYQPLEAISNTIGSLQDRFVGLQIAYRVFDTPPVVQEAPHAVEIERAGGRVAFEDVWFDYPGRSGTLKAVSFETRPGEVIAIVGPTGAGKSTLMSLIPRFYDPLQGRITLDGRDVRELTLNSLRAQIAMVLQEPLLFSGSVADNIRYGRFEATEEEVQRAAMAANCHDFIMRLPQQYDTLVGERGVQLSGGERQRICVARAFLKDAPVLILDEPTSSIDSRTEALILDALDELMAGRTTFIIAHRLSTIRHADKIIVLDHGELTEQGTHEELLRLDGTYRQLYMMQTSWTQRVRRMEPALESVVAGLGGSDNEVRALLALEETCAGASDPVQLARTAIDWCRSFLDAEAAAFAIGGADLPLELLAAEPPNDALMARTPSGSAVERVLLSGQPEQIVPAAADAWLAVLASGSPPNSAGVCLSACEGDGPAMGILAFSVREPLPFEAGILRLAGHTIGRRLAALTAEGTAGAGTNGHRIPEAAAPAPGRADGGQV